MGLVDLKTNTSFFLKVGETQEGIELVQASYEDEEAVLRKGAEMAVIKLETGEIQNLTPSEQQERLNQARMSRQKRALRRRQRAEKETPPPKPRLSGEELLEHLQEYQEEVIRQGLPPLPLPLTQEQDDRLVEEGFLPPQEEEE